VAIEVADTGCGIPESNIDKIFEPFFTTRKDTGGTGLGLALCRMLISEMDGQIEVSSVPKQGTIFRLILNAAGHDFDKEE
jgi:signal transduction histidine kinase